VEQFIRDVMERRVPGEFRPLLSGYQQGAVLALAAACRWPEMLTGVAAICGELPILPSEFLALEDLTGLPVLLVQDPEPAIPRARLKSTLNTLKGQGAVVQLVELEGVAHDPRLAVLALRDWAHECLTTTFRTDFNWEIGL
jgi:predicted esterase